MKRILARNQAKQAMKLLHISSVAKRALTLEELREAIALEPYQSSLVSHNLPNDMEIILRSCCGFVFADEEEQTVHFMHHSVKKFLFSKSMGPDVCTFSQSNLDKELGLLCMTYLNLDCFQRQLAKAGNAALSNIDPIGIPQVVLPKNSLSKKLALLLLRGESRTKPKTTYDLRCQLHDAYGLSKTSYSERDFANGQFRFLAYARSFWIHHVPMLDDASDAKSWHLFCNCVNGADSMIERPWKSFEQQVTTPGLKWLDELSSEFRWVWINKHSALLKCIESYGTDNISTEARDQMFLKSAELGHLEFVKILASSNKIQSLTLNQALHDAAKRCHIEMVEPLLFLGADGNRVLQWAAVATDLEAVESLLVAGVNVNGSNNSPDTRTPLQVAAQAGHIEIVRRLLAAGANVDATGGNDGIDNLTPLYAAAEGGHTHIVETLLAAGANVDYWR